MNDCNKKPVAIRDSKGILMQGEISYYEFVQDDDNLCSVSLSIGSKVYESVEEYFFTALQRVREQLEKENLQILCNGAARNVYPSGMMLDMGASELGYKIYMNKDAKRSDIVNIFDYDDSLEFVTVEEQERFYEEWIKCPKK